MLRNMNLNEETDGCRYRANDMVRVGCNDCNGCSECCHNMVQTIRLDPYDIFQLCINLNTSLEKLLAGGYINLQVVDGLIEPTLAMSETTQACPFLDADGRCAIHAFRPGFCRLFPLGRIYEDGDFYYCLQVKECPYPHKTKVKVERWLGIPNLKAYEDYIRKWHADIVSCREEIAADGGRTDLAKKRNMERLNTYFVKPYDRERSFYEQFEERRGV